MGAKPVRGTPVKAFRSITEVSDELGLQPHTLRFWERKFFQIRPVKRAGGRRYYRPEDVELIRRIQTLVHVEGFTIRGAQRNLIQQYENPSDAKFNSNPIS